MADTDKTPTLSEQYHLEKEEKLNTATKPAEEVAVVDSATEAVKEVVAAEIEESSATPETESSESENAASDGSTESPDATSGESNEAGESVTAATTEESSKNTEEDNVGDKEVEETSGIKLETAPAGLTINQCRHCFTRYIENHRCMAAKGEGAPESSSQIDGESGSSYEVGEGDYPETHLSGELPLLEVYNIVYYGQDELRPKDQVGMIKVIDEYKQEYCLYNSSKENCKNLPLIGNGQQLRLSGPTNDSIPSDVAFTLDVDLGDGVFKASIPFSSLDDCADRTYQEISIEGKDGSSQLSVLFAQFSFAVEAYVKLELCSLTSDFVSEGDVYGLVAARTSAFQHPMFTSLLFSARQSHTRRLAHGEIPLFRSVVIVPTDSKLYLDVTMFINGVKVGGVVKLHPRRSGGCDSQYLRLDGEEGLDGEEDGGIKVTVTWRGR